MKLPKKIYFSDTHSCNECPFFTIIESRSDPDGVVNPFLFCQAGFAIMYEKENNGKADRPLDCMKKLGS